MRPVSPRRTPAARARAIAASWGYFLPPLTDEAKDGKAPEVRQTASPVRKTKPPEEKPKDLNAELFEAVKTEDAKAIAELVGNGAEVDARNSSQKTALMYAAEKGKIGIAEMLIENGADLKAADGEGRTALMLAIVFNRSETVKMLISKGADVNAEDSHQRTPLILAAGRGNIRTVEMLISNGADVNAEDEKGRTALDVATNKGHAKIAKMLEQRLKHEAKDAGATPAAGVAAPKPAADSGEVKPEPKEAEAKPITELFIPNTRIYSDIPEARPSLLEELRPNESEKPLGHKAKPPPHPRDNGKRKSKP